MRKLALSILVALAFMAGEVRAHKVVMDVYPGGPLIEGEVGFSNGDMSAHQRVDVYDEQGNRLGETSTGDDGFFTFKPSKAVAHVFRADLGAGHVGQAVLKTEDLPAIDTTQQISQPAPNTSPSTGLISDSGPSDSSIQATGGITSDTSVTARLIRDELRPLRREIAAYKEKNDLQTILGGIGYIVGIFGLLMYLSARRKLKDAPT